MTPLPAAQPIRTAFHRHCCNEKIPRRDNPQRLSARLNLYKRPAKVTAVTSKVVLPRPTKQPFPGRLKARQWRWLISAICGWVALRTWTFRFGLGRGVWRSRKGRLACIGVPAPSPFLSVRPVAVNGWAGCLNVEAGSKRNTWLSLENDALQQTLSSLSDRKREKGARPLKTTVPSTRVTKFI